MSNEEKKILKKICEKVGEKESYIAPFVGLLNINSKLSKDALLGFLNRKETLVAWYGENPTDKDHCLRCECMDDIGLPIWKFHAKQMVGMSIVERIEYMDKTI